MESDRHRRRISRRTFLTAAATGVGSVALAACGQTTAAPTTGATSPAASTGAAAAQPSASASAAAVASTAPTPTPVVLGTGSQQVTFWHGLGGADGATMVQMLEQYASEKPEITISSETYAWDLYYQKLPTATAAGTPPNLGLQHQWSTKQFAAQGLLQDADTLFFSQGLVPKDDYNPALIEELTVDGVTQAVPFDNAGWLNWVNTKVIKDAGLDPNNLPKNGTEFIEWAQRIVVDENGKHPNEEGFDRDRIKIYAMYPGWPRFNIVSTIWQFGGGLFSDDGKQSLLNDPKTIAAVQYWHDLSFKHHVAPVAVPGLPPSVELFASNSLALMWNGTWNLNFFKDNPEAMEVMQPMPLNSLAPDGKQAVRFDSHIFIVPQGVQEQNLQAAKDLIVWLSNHAETWATSGQVPARSSVQQQPSVQEIPSVKVAAQQFQEFGRAGQSHPAINEIVTAYEAAFSAALAGTTPPEQAMNEAHTTVQSILDRG